ncbi:IS3 family transposase [uncultured Ruminobacter sp.]
MVDSCSSSIHKSDGTSGHEHEFNTPDKLKDAMEEYIHYCNNNRVRKN